MPHPWHFRIEIPMGEGDDAAATGLRGRSPQGRLPSVPLLSPCPLYPSSLLLCAPYITPNGPPPNLGLSSPRAQLPSQRSPRPQRGLRSPGTSRDSAQGTRPPACPPMQPPACPPMQPTVQQDSHALCLPQPPGLQGERGPFHGRAHRDGFARASAGQARAKSWGWPTEGLRMCHDLFIAPPVSRVAHSTTC